MFGVLFGCIFRLGMECSEVLKESLILTVLELLCLV